MMFGRKKPEQLDSPDPLAPENLVAPVVLPTARPPAEAATPPVSALNQPSSIQSLPNRIPTMPPRPTAPEIARPSEPLRRPIELASMAPQPAAPRPEPAERQLIVGREITLQGDIKTCDLLVIEGSVQANLADCREVSISETGLFKGDATVDNIEVRGRFEGNLTVNGRLLIHSTGTVTGTIRYGQIQIECGGQVAGDIQSQQSKTIETPDFRKERASQSVVEIDPTRLV